MLLMSMKRRLNEVGAKPADNDLVSVSHVLFSQISIHPLLLVSTITASENFPENESPQIRRVLSKKKALIPS